MISVFSRRLAAPVLAAAALIFAAQPVLQAAEAVPNARRLPKSVLAHVSIPNVTDLKTKFGASQFGELAADPSVKEVRAQVEAKIAEITDGFLDQLGMKLETLATLPRGEFSVSVLTTKGRPNAVLMLEFGEGKEAVAKLLEKATEALEGAEMARTEDEYEGTDLVLFGKKKSDDDKDAPQRQPAGFFDAVCWATKDTSLIVATSPDTIKAVLRNWDGEESNTLAENETFASILERCADKDGTPEVTWFVDPIGLVRIAAARAGGQAAMGLVGIPLVNLDQLRGMGGTIEMGGEEFDSVGRTLVVMDQPAKGAMRLFQFPATNQAPPKWVGRNVISYYTINWDVETAYSAVESLYATLAGLTGAKQKFSELIDELAKNPESGNIHLKKDIVDQLSGKIHVVGAKATEANPSRALIALELKDPAAFEKAFAKITGHPGFPNDARREFQGTALYEIKSEQVTVSFAIVRQHLMFTTDVTLLEQVIRGGEEALAEAPEFLRVSKKFPTETSSTSFTRYDEQLAAMWGQLRSNEQISEFGVDLTKLPPFETVRKYFTAGGSYMLPDAKGMLWVSFTLKRGE